MSIRPSPSLRTEKKHIRAGNRRVSHGEKEGEKVFSLIFRISLRLRNVLRCSCAPPLSGIVHAEREKKRKGIRKCPGMRKRGKWWALPGLNQRPNDYESSALTTELRARSREVNIPEEPAFRKAEEKVFSRISSQWRKGNRLLPQGKDSAKGPEKDSGHIEKTDRIISMQFPDSERLPEELPPVRSSRQRLRTCFTEGQTPCWHSRKILSGKEFREFAVQSGCMEAVAQTSMKGSPHATMR